MTEATRLLIADDDPDLLDTLACIFRDEGYAVVSAASLDAAIDCVERETFAFVLTDLFDHSPVGLEQLGALRDAAYPTPVVGMSAWRVPQEEVARARLASFITKPFDLDDLLSHVAAAISVPMTPDQARQERIVQAFFHCLSEGDWDGAVSLCRDDVIYVAPHGIPIQRSPIVGRAAYRTYIEETVRRFPGFRIGEVRVVPTPRGLAVRYTVHWDQGGRACTSAGVVVEFDAQDHVRQIGVYMSDQRVLRLQAAS